MPFLARRNVIARMHIHRHYGTVGPDLLASQFELDLEVATPEQIAHHATCQATGVPLVTLDDAVRRTQAGDPDVETGTEHIGWGWVLTECNFAECQYATDAQFRVTREQFNTDNPHLAHIPYPED